MQRMRQFNLELLHSHGLLLWVDSRSSSFNWFSHSCIRKGLWSWERSFLSKASDTAGIGSDFHQISQLFYNSSLNSSTSSWRKNTGKIKGARNWLPRWRLRSNKRLYRKCKILVVCRWSARIQGIVFTLILVESFHLFHSLLYRFFFGFFFFLLSDCSYPAKDWTMFCFPNLRHLCFAFQFFFFFFLYHRITVSIAPRKLLQSIERNYFFSSLCSASYTLSLWCHT